MRCDYENSVRFRRIYYDGTKQLAEEAVSYEKYSTNEVNYLNGQLKFKDTLNYNWERIGNFKHYYDNGNLKEEGVYEDGLREGYWKFFYKNGQLHSEGSFVKGKEEGIVKCYCENGTLKVEKSFKWGVYNGWFKYYNCEGKLNLKENYVMGKRKSREKIK
ncbi:MAG: hypothetical protein JKY50_01265 [Oleispira sp.]|nr:hypothetical protein [Oleispira sp.]